MLHSDLMFLLLDVSVLKLGHFLFMLHHYKDGLNCAQWKAFKDS